MKMIFYPPVNTDKPKFVAFLVFVSSVENVLKRDAILAPIAKRRIAEDIPELRESIKTRENCYSLIW